LATQTLLMKKSKNMLVRIDGRLQPGSTAKDIVLAVIGKIGTAGGTGYTIEFSGEAIRNLSMEGRMTVCNMAIEAGARAGLVAVDETTIEYIQGRPYSPKGETLRHAMQYWRTLHSDADAKFDAVVELRAEEIAPQVTWGTSPEMVLDVSDRIPDPEKERDPNKRSAMERALEYMNLIPNTLISNISIDKVFIGSCTNSRIEDMRAAAKVVDRLGKKVAANVKLAIVVPGSGLVKAQAEREGLDRVFKAAGFEWREPGCSMCLAMNADRLEPGERCASTSNRNFEGRQLWPLPLRLRVILLIFEKYLKERKLSKPSFTMIKKLCIVGVVGIALSACANTMEGVGKDLQTLGNSMGGSNSSQGNSQSQTKGKDVVVTPVQ